MTRRRHPRPPTGEHRITLDRLGHDGRAIGKLDGKTVFVEGALPGEDVSFRYTFTRKSFDEGVVSQVHTPSPQRVLPPCAFADMCGGCSLQHVANDAQITFKQDVMLEQLRHFGNVVPREVLPPLLADTLGYRKRARLAARFVQGKGGVLVGFREKRSAYIAAIDHCAVLIPAVGDRIGDLRELLSGLQAKDRLAQIEVAAGDDAIALIFRHLDPLVPSDEAAIADTCKRLGFECWLQPGSEESTHRVWPALEETPGSGRLVYRLDDFGVELRFHPKDFTQVNAGINRQMVKRAIELLEPQSTDRVLDLFCGLGNFTLPIATRAAQVTGVEGSAAMVERGNENVAHNRMRGVTLGETRFFAANLDGDFAGAAWARERYDRILIDPPRSGAEQACRAMHRFDAGRIVYVSCNPATLARDAGILVEQGYVLEKAGVMDMFPHTTHVESLAVFSKSPGRHR